MAKLSTRIVCAAVFLFLAAGAFAVTFTPLIEQVSVEKHIEERLSKGLIPVIGEKNFVVIVNVTLNSQRTESFKESSKTTSIQGQNVSAARGEVLPGISQRTEISKAPEQSDSTKTVQATLTIPPDLIKSIMVVLILDKNLTSQQVEAAKNLSNLVLSLNKARGDTLTVKQADLNLIKELPESQGGTAPGGGGSSSGAGGVNIGDIIKIFITFIAIAILVLYVVGRISKLTMTAVKTMTEAGGGKGGGGAVAAVAAPVPGAAAAAVEKEESSGFGGGRGGSAVLSAGEEGKVIKRPFSFIAPSESKRLMKILESEESKTIANVLSAIDPKVSADIMFELSEKLPEDTYAYMTSSRELTRKEIDTMEDKIKARLEGSLGGTEDMLRILDNAFSVVTEKVLEALGKTDPENAAKLRAEIVLFSDILKLEDALLLKLLIKCKLEDIAMVIQASDETVKDRFIKNLPEESAAVVKEWLEMMPKQTVSVVEKAKKKLNNIARQLEKSGEITISRT